MKNTQSTLMVTITSLRQAEMRASRVTEEYYENIALPWYEHLYHLKGITEKIDLLAKVSPDEQLIPAIKAISTLDGNDIEKELAGTWYKMCSLSSALGYDLKEIYPDVARAVNERLKALHELLYESNYLPLRSIAEMRPDLLSLKRMELGRPKGITSLTDFLGSWGDELSHEGLPYATAAERILRELKQLIEPDEVEKEALFELERRPQKRYQGKTQETRGDYLKQIVRRWRDRQNKVGSKSF